MAAADRPALIKRHSMRNDTYLRLTSYLVFGVGILAIVGLVKLVCWALGIELPSLPESGPKYPVD